jgi:hypothetical protein
MLVASRSDSWSSTNQARRQRSPCDPAAPSGSGAARWPARRKGSGSSGRTTPSDLRKMSCDAAEAVGSASAKPDASAQPDDFDCERASERGVFFESESARSDALIAIKGPSIGCR